MVDHQIVKEAESVIEVISEIFSLSTIDAIKLVIDKMNRNIKEFEYDYPLIKNKKARILDLRINKSKQIKEYLTKKLEN